MRKYISAVVFSVLASVSAVSSANDVGAGASATQSEQAETINLNAADADKLHRGLVGVGEAKAKAIVAYREAHGPFQSVDELLEVKGIGAAILDKNRSRLQL